MPETVADRRWMVEALRLARRGLDSVDPNPRVGCLLVRGDAVVGEGWHERAGGPHAEVRALAAAGGQARGATAYVTLEPCCHHGRTPPCTDALIKAGIARVVYALRDPDPRVAGGGEVALRAAGITVCGGVLAGESARLNAGFVHRLQHGRPLVRSKIAASLDGRTALADGRSRWITSAAARADVQRWRARSSAILTGIGTVLADDPRLDVRPDDGQRRQPLRLVLDSGLRLPPAAAILRPPGQALIVAGRDERMRRAALEAAGAEVVVLPGAGGRVDLAALLSLCARRAINELLVEAGAGLNGALLEAGFIDELLVYQAPVVLGHGARGMFAIHDLAGMDGRPTFELREVRRVGADLRLTWARRVE